MTSLSLLESTSPIDKRVSPEVCTPSPPNSPVFQSRLPSPEEACALVKATVKAPSAGSGALADRKRARLGFPDRVYSHAAHIFQEAHVEKPLANRVICYAPTIHTHTEDSAETVCGDDSNSKSNKLWAFELAFSTLKFQELLEDVLTDSCFYPSQQMPDDLMSLVVVMLYDLQDRKFQPREPMSGEGEEPIEEVRRVESSLFSFRTKLAASLARCRVKRNLLSIDDILPKNLREKHSRKHKLPLCAWVNTLRISVEDVSETLRQEGFIQVDPHTRLKGSLFCKEADCPDLLLFPHQAQEKLNETLLMKDHSLIIQARFCSLAVSAVHPLLVKGADILMVGSFSAQTVAHVAIHASAYDARVHICGLLSNPRDKDGLQSAVSAIGCKNVQFLSDAFAGLNEWDSHIQKVRVILLLPQCTASGLCNPIEHILREGGDRELLRDLSQGTISDTKLESLVTKQMQDLSHALTFPKVNAVIYCTCSVYREENELLVRRALENASVKPKLRPFRIVSTGLGDKEEKFFRLEESDSDDGCFICVLKRDQEPAEPETVQDILARAAAKGLLGGLITLEPSDQVKPKKKKKEKQKAAAELLPPLFPLQTAISDTTRLLNDISVPESLRSAVHIRANTVSVNTVQQTLNFTAEDSSDFFCSSVIHNEVSTTLNQASDQVSAISDQDSTASNTSAKRANDQKNKSESPRRVRRTKVKAKSHTHTTKAHRSPQSRKRQLHKRQAHRQTHVRTHTLASSAAIAHPLTPAPPPSRRPTALKSQTSLEELQKLPRRKRQQQETSQETFGTRPAALDLSGVIKVKQDVKIPPPLPHLLVLISPVDSCYPPPVLRVETLSGQVQELGTDLPSRKLPH
ncbi:putative methyltransferase NSUN7 [Salminus brasiliensis]|uniref:putative methyltransferase NSUN7 n=1 Tax=Salminus brasiliensis TaxID=930266 RepID=UPI003B82EEDD